MEISRHTSCIFLTLILYIFPGAPATWQAPVKYPEIRQISARNPSPVCDVRNHGATGDGKTFDTRSIQAAIDDCSSKGGGRVRFPAGSYLTATIFLKTGVILDVGEGATILGSPFQRDYPAESSRWYLVLAEKAMNVGITGGGTVDGQSLKFVTRFDAKKNVMVSWNATGDCLGDECRPRLLGFLGCQNVHLWNIHLKDPAYWCLHLVRSNNISIHDVSIYGDFNTPNNDGIDIEDSNNTIITRCTIDTGDDAICPKTYTAPLYNLTATNCWIRTKSSAIKLGSASFFNFENLFFDNITVVDSHRGLALQIRDEGNVNGVTFSNINISTRYYDPSWWGRAEPIYVTACPRNPSTVVGLISNVRFVNITATSENGIFLAGSKESILTKIELINVKIKLKRWTNYEGDLLDYRPGCQGLVHHHTAGVMMEYLSDVILNNVNMTWALNKTANWEVPMDFKPSTVKKIYLSDFQSAMYK
uniref:Pectate lyase superfamily protein domain-containing protein n=1 Tax=Araucaria cunninghamii TaxID=56994 RepID=A0A0D6R5Q4_ARACU